MDYEIKYNGFRLKEDIFNISLKNLLKGYLKSEIIQHSRYYTRGKQNENTISFINPSIGDFLIHYLSKNGIEKERIFLSTAFLEQITKTFHPSKKGYLRIDKSDQDKWYDHFVSNFKQLNSLEETKFNEKNSNYKLYKKRFFRELEILSVLVSFFHKKVEHELAKSLFEKIDLELISRDQKEIFFYFVKQAKTSEKISKVVLENWEPVILGLITVSNYTVDFHNIIDLFKIYEKSIVSFLCDEDNRNTYTHYLSTAASDEVNERLYEEEYDFDVHETFEYSDYGEPIGVDIEVSLSSDLETSSIEHLISWEEDNPELIYFKFNSNIIEIEIELDIDYESIKDDLIKNYKDSYSKDMGRDDYDDGERFYQPPNEDERIMDLFN